MTTRPDTPVAITPLADQAPPPGQAWDYASMRIVDPATGEPETTVKTKQGSWVLGPKPGVVTFTPATRFTGTASIEYRIASTGGTAFAATIYATVTKRRTATATATVYFASGSAVLTKQAKATLDALVHRVDRRAARVLSGETVGYVQATTFTGNDISLSTARARNIKQYLVAKGIRPITTSEGLGKAQEPGAKARRATATITYTPRR